MTRRDRILTRLPNTSSAARGHVAAIREWHALSLSGFLSDLTQLYTQRCTFYADEGGGDDYIFLSHILLIVVRYS